ncbi:MAG TPA: hypothetical protein VHJ18_01135 [Streptosporangiaceae bacterium]|nr:hypothetical protein [Streptosporangiaceae bacterium]
MIWPSAGEVTMIDLDPAVCRRRTGEVEQWDEDELITETGNS